MVGDGRDALEAFPGPGAKLRDSGRVRRYRLAALQRAPSQLDAVPPAPEPLHPGNETASKKRERRVLVKPDASGREHENAQDDRDPLQEERMLQGWRRGRD